MPLTMIQAYPVARDALNTPAETAGAASAPVDVVIAAPYREMADELAAALQRLNHSCRIQRADDFDAERVDWLAGSPGLLLIHHRLLVQPEAEFVSQILAQHPGLRILLFGQDLEDSRLLRLLCAGIQGYLPGTPGDTDLQRATAAVMSGKTWVEHSFVARCLGELQSLHNSLEADLNDRIADMSEQLTRREREILCQVIRGYAIKQIAAEVHLSHQGVKMHLARLFRKFGASNRNQLILAVLDRVSPMANLSHALCATLHRSLREDADT
jgi:DNA-binding NarL/FixJ family response regulator